MNSTTLSKGKSENFKWLLNHDFFIFKVLLYYDKFNVHFEKSKTILGKFYLKVTGQCLFSL